MRGCARRAAVQNLLLLLLPPLLVTAAGCTTTRTFTIYSVPPDAKLIIDGVEHGSGPVTKRFEFNGKSDIRYVTATREGYKASTEGISATTPDNTVVLRLDAVGPKVVLTVEPEPAIVKLDGVPVKSTATRTAEVTLDPNRPDREYVVTAEHPRYETAVRRVTRPGFYELFMRPLPSPGNGQGGQAVARQTPPAGRQTPVPTQPSTQRPTTQPPVAQEPRPPRPEPLKRDVAVRTEPPDVGAEITIDDTFFGKNGASITGHEFMRGPDGRPLPQTVTATAPGFEGGSVVMKWEDNRREYVVPLGNRVKTVRITTLPSDATVSVNDKPASRTSDGRHEARLTFPPGREQTYVARAVPPAGKPEFEPQDVTIGWDNGKTDYRIELRRATIVKVPLVAAVPVWDGENGWRIEARRTETLAARDTSEPDAPQPPQRLGELPAGAMVDAVAVSRDGSYVLYTLLSFTPDGELKSRMRLLNGDGSPGPPLASDARFADLSPSFTPDGGRILFSSDRTPGLLEVWQLTLGGAGGGDVKPMARGGNAALWPTLDSSPQTRLFYESVLKPDESGAGGSEVRMVEGIDTPAPRSITLAEGSRPRVSPRADSVVYTARDPKTGNRDLYLISDEGGTPLGGTPVNLTNTPDVDECDPAWSRNGTRIVFASNAEADETGRRHYDIWWMPVSRDGPQKPVRVTSNGSWDDSPAWDPAGKQITFRSNRGGRWGIWRVAIAE